MAAKPKRRYSRDLLAAIAQNKDWPCHDHTSAYDRDAGLYCDKDYALWQTMADACEPDELWDAYLAWQGFIGYGPQLKRHCLELFGAL